MKKWYLVGVIALLVIGYGAGKYIMKVVQAPNEIEGYKVEEASSGNHDQTIKVGQDQVHQGNLLLVNRKYPVHASGVVDDVVNLARSKELLQGYGLLNTKIQLSRGVAEKFIDMIGKAAKDGVNRFLISSGYRDEAEQTQLYKEMGADYALPAGYSEHNLGLSLDIGSSQAEMNRAPEGKWLLEHAWTYGFILRYPKDKTEITGIQYEPWHFRYVGLPHSIIMKQENLTLEEYLDYLKEKKKLTITIGEKHYDVAYYPVSKKDTKIPVPSKGQYEVSGNNVDGVIVTAF
ncbi:D-alanyl-D-alanine carboxypeptidase family protein [Paenibacillus sp. N1-5-1-14]|uniref:D-alanyl-D-alanine carboxypeptidase family protein n=1 Tax=Paenibacillus radicibacter TaxID=2972488 RepID=UPI002159B502|nr:D-alanyl-D-alanine carboxypeptidase family protein [Paenibacillus radicibacter]MCR8642880.1 D-alanyl-D-alanine carboxypeptidase family protein [Paenibacillus radicibacter]